MALWLFPCQVSCTSWTYSGFVLFLQVRTDGGEALQVIQLPVEYKVVCFCGITLKLKFSGWSDHNSKMMINTMPPGICVWHTEETRRERDTCTPMFIAALFIIARTWKQPRCPSADEWIRKLWYIYTMEYYSAIKKNTFESVLMRWMKLEPIIQSEVSQKEKHQYSILMHIYGI